LTSVRHEYEAVQAAVSALMQDTSLPSYSQVMLADRNLENTYITRLFSEFEGILRAYLAAYQPSRPVPRAAFRLIDRSASLFRIPTAIRDGAHSVRDHRNVVVHAGIAVASALSFADALSSLNKFLAWLS
jgi:hypothetical protein